MGNDLGDPLPDLYIAVATWGGADGIGLIQSIGDEDTTIDLCYRIHFDGSIHAWVAQDGESEESELPIYLEFDHQGEVDNLVIEFTCGYMAEYRVWSFDDIYFPSEELTAYSVSMAKSLY